MSDLVFMCADTGAVVSLHADGETLRTVVFLTTGETAWGDRPWRGPLGSTVRVSDVATLYHGPAEVPASVGRQVPYTVDVTVVPAGLPVTLAGDRPRTAGAVRVTGSVTVGSVPYRVDAAGWTGGASAVGQAVFQDRSAVYLAGDDTGALVVNTAARAVPVRELVVDDRRLRGVLELRSPGSVSAEIRDTEQYLTFGAPSAGGDGWVARRLAPFVFVRSGITGIGLVEWTTRTLSAEPPRPAADELPDPY